MTAAIALGVAGLALVLAVVLAVRVSRLQRRLAVLPEDGGIFEALRRLDADLAANEEAVAALRPVVQSLHERLPGAICHTGVVAFDASGDLAGGLSRSIALLERAGRRPGAHRAGAALRAHLLRQDAAGRPGRRATLPRGAAGHRPGPGRVARRRRRAGPAACPTMGLVIDLELLRRDPEGLAAALGRRHLTVDVAELAALDRRRREARARAEEQRAAQKRSGKEIAGLKGEAKEAAIAAAARLAEDYKGALAEAEALDAAFDEVWRTLPNPPHASAPDGLAEADNVEVKRWGEIPDSRLPGARPPRPGRGPGDHRHHARRQGVRGPLRLPDAARPPCWRSP